MRRFLFICVCFCVVASVTGRELYSEAGISFVNDSEYADTISDPYSAFDYHLRVAVPPKTANAEWFVALVYADSQCSLRQIIFSREGKPSQAGEYGIPLHVTYIQCHEAQQQKVSISENISIDSDEWSFVIRHQAGADSMICEIGQRQALESFSLPVAGLKYIIAHSGSNLKLKRLSFFTDAENKARYIALDKAAIDDYLAASNDINESVWRYLDRDVDARKFVNGGDYRLATIASPEGGYDIVYIDGARINSAAWETGRVKGRLVPTTFINHYDLVWYDAYGREITADASADIIDGSILRLNFPLNSSSIRFQRGR